MFILSKIGCQIFFWMGLLDAQGCDELRIQEENLDTLMWFKLLFVPTLGIIILTLFLLEDYCYSFQRARELEQTQKGKARKAWLHPQRNKQLPVTRLNFIDEAGFGNCYKVKPSVQMSDVIEFYCQKHDVHANAIIFRHAGKKLVLSESVESLGLLDLATIEVETDYKQLYEVMDASANIEREQLTKQVQDEKTKVDEFFQDQLVVAKETKTQAKLRKELENRRRNLEVMPLIYC